MRRRVGPRPFRPVPLPCTASARGSLNAPPLGALHARLELAVERRAHLRGDAPSPLVDDSREHFAMPFHLTRNESVASRRVIPIWCVGSNGTTPATAEAGGQPTWMLGGVYYGATVNTLSAWSANAGEYYVLLAQSETSVLGQGMVRYSSGNAIETATPFEVKAFDSFDSTRGGLVALPNAVAAATGGLLIVGTGAGSVNPSLGSVGLVPFDYSSVVTVGVGKVAAATYSGVTFDGVNRVNSSVTPANAVYSGVTVRVDPQAYSGLSVGVTNIAAGQYSGVTVEVSNILQSARSKIADDFLLRNIASGGAGGRSVQEALRVLRNRVEISGSTMTVYSEDDQTSSWTAGGSTAADAAAISAINPAGGTA